MTQKSSDSLRTLWHRTPTYLLQIAVRGTFDWLAIACRGKSPLVAYVSVLCDESVVVDNTRYVQQRTLMQLSTLEL